MHAAGVMFACPDGRVLFLLRAVDADNHPSTWCFPGGSIEPGEGPKAAARREAQEEVGYYVHRLGRMIHQHNGFATFRVAIGAPFEPVLNGEHSLWIWAHPDDAPQPLHPGIQETLDKQKRLPKYQNLGVRVTAAGRKLRAMDAKPTINAVRPSAPIRIGYQRRLDALVDEMAQSLLYWLRAAYRADTPATVQLGQDSAAGILQAAFSKLSQRWLRKFDDLAPKMADWFAVNSRARVDGTMQADLRKGGFTVKFKPSKAMNDAFGAVVEENIGLIRSIGEQHLAGVQTALMQSVQNGRDLQYLTNEITKRTGVTKRRAARIARDQNNKATAVMVKTRALELGVTKARWLHSAGGKVPRPEHVKFSGQTFDLAKGHDFGDGEGYTWPGVPINCRCVAVPIVPGFE